MIIFNDWICYLKFQFWPNNCWSLLSAHNTFCSQRKQYFGFWKQTLFFYALFFPIYLLWLIGNPTILVSLQVFSVESINFVYFLWSWGLCYTFFRSPSFSQLLDFEFYFFIHTSALWVRLLFEYKQECRNPKL